MFRVDTPTAVVSVPAQQAAGTPGYFTKGDAAGGVPATIPGPDWFNIIQEEIMAVVLAGGQTPAKTTVNQLLSAINTIVAAQTIVKFTVGGTIAALTGTPSPALAANVVGTRYNVTFPLGATGSLAVSNLAALNLKYMDVNGTIQQVTAAQVPAGYNADIICISISSTLYWLVMSTALPAFSSWTAISAFTAQPASTSTITVGADYTAVIPAGSPAKYVIGGVTFIGQYSAVAANLLTIAGPPLSGAITALYYGTPEKVKPEKWIFPAYWEAESSAQEIQDCGYSSFVWRGPTAYLPRFLVYSKVYDSGTAPQVNVLIGGNPVCTSNANAGLTVSASATWYASVVDISPTYYKVNYGDVVEIKVTKSGNGNATDLTVDLVWIYP